MTAPPVRTGIAAAARCLALDQHAARTVAALRAAGVSAVLLKGAGLAQRLYPQDPSRRRYSDIDLLVGPSDFERAEHVLAVTGHRDVSGGFPRDQWLWHERAWAIGDVAPLVVDLHRSFAGVGDPQALWRLLSGRSEELLLAGEAAQVPDAAGCALLVALHAAAPGPGRKAVTDLAAALTRFDETTWAAAAELAAATSAAPAFTAGLTRIPAGAALAGRLGTREQRPLLDRVVLRADLILLRRALEDIRRVPGWRRRACFVARRLVPTPGFLRRSSQIARRGWVGLVAGYLLRPLRLLWPARNETARRERWLRTLGRRTGHAARLGPMGVAAKLRAACWTKTAMTQVRHELVTRPLDQVRVPPAPRVRPIALTPVAVGAVRRVLRRRGASCLERTLVLQRWYGAQGRREEVVVGVTAPGSGFAAHAWLASEADDPHHGGFTELLRRPTPPSWLTTS